MKKGQTISFYVCDVSGDDTIACQYIEKKPFCFESDHFKITSGAMAHFKITSGATETLWNPTELDDEFRPCIGCEYIVV